jgi:hypothetical protein
MVFAFSGLIVVLADTAFRPEGKRAQRKLHRPIVRSPNVGGARELPDLKEAESRSLGFAKLRKLAIEICGAADCPNARLPRRARERQCAPNAYQLSGVHLTGDEGLLPHWT